MNAGVARAQVIPLANRLLMLPPSFDTKNYPGFVTCQADIQTESPRISRRHCLAFVDLNNTDTSFDNNKE